MGAKNVTREIQYDQANPKADKIQLNRKFAYFETPALEIAASQPKRCEVSPRRSLLMTDYRVNRGEAQEDQVTAAIEKTTSRVPSSAFLALALGAMAVSATFQAMSRKHESLFIGQWAAPFLLLGIYNKMVKQHGSDGIKGSRNISEGYSNFQSPERSYSQTAAGI